MNENRGLPTGMSEIHSYFSALERYSIELDTLLPNKRKDHLKSCIANLEINRWRELAYYVVVKHYDFKQYVYAYAPVGIRNRELACEVLELFNISPIDALTILNDKHSQNSIMELIGEC